MQRSELGDIIAFLAIVEEGGFTRAAARLGTSQSALSHAMRRLEDHLKVRLLNRTTRSVSLTQAGKKLLATIKPAFDDIKSGLASLEALREQPAGTIRITASPYPAHHILWPSVQKLMRDYPDLNIEITTDKKLTDIVGDNFECGVRLGEAIEKDMIAVRIGPDIRMAVVGSPAYFEHHPKPLTPHDLIKHNCINIRQETRGNLYAWEFEKDGRELNVRVKGQFISNDEKLIIKAAQDGVGLACLPDNELEDALRRNQVIRVLEDWCPPFAGYHLYYPSRRQHPIGFAMLIDRLRWRG